MSIKQTDRALFLAMQADAKDFPGGIRGLANFMGRNNSTLSNQLNTEHESAPPSLEVFVELIKLTKGRRTALAIAHMVDQVTMDLPSAEVSTDDPKACVELFMALVHESSEVLSAGSEFARDLRFDGAERKAL